MMIWVEGLLPIASIEWQICIYSLSAASIKVSALSTTISAGKDFRCRRMDCIVGLERCRASPRWSRKVWCVIMLDEMPSKVTNRRAINEETMGFSLSAALAMLDLPMPPAPTSAMCFPRTRMASETSFNTPSLPKKIEGMGGV